MIERLQRAVDRLLSNACDACKRLDETMARCEQISFELKESTNFNEQLTAKNKDLDQESTRLNEERKTLLMQVYQLQQQLGQSMFSILDSCILHHVMSSSIMYMAY